MSQFLYHVPKYVPKSWTLFLFDFDETEGVQMRIWNSYYLKSIKYARARPRRIFKDSCRNSEFGVVHRVQYLRKGIVCKSACLFLGHHFYVPEWGLSCNLARQFLVQTSYIQYYRTGRPGTSFLCPRYFWDIKMMYQICFHALCARVVVISYYLSLRDRYRRYAYNTIVCRPGTSFLCPRSNWDIKIKVPDSFVSF